MSKGPFKIALLYLLISIFWIVVSDHFIKLLSLTFGGNEDLLQAIKSIFFVLVTAVLLYLLIRKQQHTLHHSEKKYKNLFYANPNPIWIYDVNTLRFLEVNNAAIQNYGYSRDEFMKMTIKDIRPSEDILRLQEAVDNLSEEYQSSGYWHHKKKNGSVMIVAIKSHRVQFNNRDCDMVMALDVTETLEQEEKARLAYQKEKELKEQLEENIKLIRQSLEEKRQLAEVIDRVNNIVIITNPRGIITWVNQAFINHTGYSFEEATGRNTDFLHGPKTDPEMQRFIMESLQKNEFPTFEILNYTKSRQEYWVELNISPIYNEKNEIERYICIQSIVTERKEKEEKIKEQNEALRKLAWTNSHALRKPVASIISLIGFCQNAKQPEEIKELHSLIKSCSGELDEIIKEMGREINRNEAKAAIPRPLSKK